MSASVSFTAVLAALASLANALPAPASDVAPAVGFNASGDGRAHHMAHVNPRGSTTASASGSAGTSSSGGSGSSYTITITNKLGKGVKTHQDSTAGTASGLTGTSNGVLANGGSASFTVEPGWNGNVALVADENGNSFLGDETLIEGSYNQQGGSDYIFDIDVSFVTGFSVPVTCSCDVGVVAGCNKDLFQLNSCPNDNGAGSCKNPERDGNKATTFFAPCQGAAYTFASDDKANTGNGVCKTNKISCCIGTSCPANSK